MSECIELHKLISKREKHHFLLYELAVWPLATLSPGKNGKAKPKNTGGHSQERNRHEMPPSCCSLSILATLMYIRVLL